MAIKTASPKDTFDHMLGSGAFSYSWWRGCRMVRQIEAANGDVEDWAADLTCEDGNDGRVTKTVNHAAVLRAARQVIESPPKYGSEALVRECKHLVFDADETDFDAAVADELLQLIVLGGEIVFG